MKVTMLQSVSTVDFTYAPGQKYDMSDMQAKQWIAAGYAKAVETVPPVVAPEPAADAAEPVPVAEAKPAARRARKASTPNPDTL